MQSTRASAPTAAPQTGGAGRGPSPAALWSGISYGFPRHPFVEPPSEDLAEGAALSSAIDRSVGYLLARQVVERGAPEDGYWVGELEANATLSAEVVFFLHLMGVSDDRLTRGIARYLLESQRPEGSWSLFHDGPGCPSTTLEAYLALKMAGVDPDSDPMARARRFVIARGGIRRSRVFTKIFLALLGEYPWEACPVLPAELMLLPNWFPLNIYEMSSWARATVVPLLVLGHYRPVVPLPPPCRIPECWVHDAPDPLDENGADGRSTWESLFRRMNGWLALYHKRPIGRLRERALQEAERWILDHQEPSGDWAGIMPPMINCPLALRARGYSNDHPAIARGMDAILRFCIEDDRGIRAQSCVSPVWDTAHTVNALKLAGLRDDHPALVRAAMWLLGKQSGRKGDWSVKRPGLEPGGWSFEFANELYPDTDDTVAAMTALRGAALPDEGAKHAALGRGLDWLLGMQSGNGGWAAFDADNTMEIWNRIPFADYKSMIDPPTPDLTGRVLEHMCAAGMGPEAPAVRGAIEFLVRTQDADGSWFGRWGVNHVYGTWCALVGLAAAGIDPGSAPIQRGVRWLKNHRNPDGGWGESCRSYEDEGSRGVGPSTASQTAWAVMGLLASVSPNDPDVRAGIAYLVRTQNALGTWDEEAFTGTGFPRFFFIRYHMYSDYFPLMALAEYRGRIVEAARKARGPERARAGARAARGGRGS